MAWPSIELARVESIFAKLSSDDNFLELRAISNGPADVEFRFSDTKRNVVKQGRKVFCRRVTHFNE